MRTGHIIGVATLVTMGIVFWALTQAERIGYIRGLIECRVDQQQTDKP